MSDQLRHRGWDLLWHGWIRGINQIVRYGFWTAHAPHEPTIPCIYRTTLGSSGVLRHEFNSLDVSRYDDSRGAIGTEIDKRDALAWLVAGIDHGRFRPSIAALEPWDGRP